MRSDQIQFYLLKLHVLKFLIPSTIPTTFWLKMQSLTSYSSHIFLTFRKKRMNNPGQVNRNRTQLPGILCRKLLPDPHMAILPSQLGVKRPKFLFSTDWLSFLQVVQYSHCRSTLPKRAAPAVKEFHFFIEYIWGTYWHSKISMIK